MQMGLMKWLFIGELSFALPVIQFSWHYEEITFLYLFLIQILYNPLIATVQTSLGGAKQLSEQCTRTICRFEHFSVLGTK